MLVLVNDIRSVYVDWRWGEKERKRKEGWRRKWENYEGGLQDRWEESPEVVTLLLCL